MALSIVDSDLLDQDVEVIVNAWNRNIIPWWLLIPQGVSGDQVSQNAGPPVSKGTGRSDTDPAMIWTFPLK